MTDDESSTFVDGVTPPPSNTTKFTTICVFCGSSPGNSPAYFAAARSLAQTMHERNIHLVYGGGIIGLMGHLFKSRVSIFPRTLSQYISNSVTWLATAHHLQPYIPGCIVSLTTVVC